VHLVLDVVPFQVLRRAIVSSVSGREGPCDAAFNLDASNHRVSVHPGLFAKVDCAGFNGSES
jgi:hypothetical protein